MPTQTQLSVHPEQRRKSAGNQQQIVELSPEKRNAEMRFHRAAIQRVQAARAEEERVAAVPKGSRSLHKARSIAAPAAVAKRILVNVMSMVLACRRGGR